MIYIIPTHPRETAAEQRTRETWDFKVSIFGNKSLYPNIKIDSKKILICINIVTTERA